jgi:hypothetical protein
MDTLLVVIITVVIAIIIGAGFVAWGSYHLARQERQNALPRPVEQPADPILRQSPVEMPPIAPPDSGYIRWGPDGQNASEPKHLRWGEETEQPPPLPLNYPNDGAQCLLTKRPIDKVLDSFIECHNCGALYLAESWRDYGASQCLNCREELT